MRIFVDAAAQIEELDENNNQVTLSFLVKTGDLFPIYPYKYAIYPSKNASLIASRITSYNVCYTKLLRCYF